MHINPDLNSAQLNVPKHESVPFAMNRFLFACFPSMLCWRANELTISSSTSGPVNLLSRLMISNFQMGKCIKPSAPKLNLFQIYVTSPGPSTRRSALRARKFLRSHANDTVNQAAKVIQTIKRHRKQRHTRLRDLTRDFDDEATTASGSGSSRDVLGRREPMECPVCMKAIHGDEDVLGAHIDSCLADQARRTEVGTTEDAEVVGHVGDVMGTWEQPL